MSQIIFLLSCLLALVCLAHCTTKTSVCARERIQLRLGVEQSKFDLEKAKQKTMPTFYNKGLKCRGYMDKETPFPIAMLGGSLRNFVGQKFLQKNYELFRPFYDAFSHIINGSVLAKTKAPEAQLWDVYLYVIELVKCSGDNQPSVVKPLPIKYDAQIHENDVKSCLVGAGIMATSKRIKIIQYNEIFEDLQTAIKGMNKLAAKIKLLRLK